MRSIDGVLYCNDGDWVESLTALVEHADGRLEIVDWAARTGLLEHTPAGGAAAPLPATLRPVPVPVPVGAVVGQELARTSSIEVTPASTFSMPS